MKKSSLYTTIQKLIFIPFLFILVLSILSCSKDDVATNNEGTAKVTDTSNREFIIKSTEPVLAGTPDVQVDMISWDNNCYKYRIIITLTGKDGQQSIGFSAIMQTGSGCENEGLVTQSYEGDYKGDFIIKDELPTGKPVRTYFDNNPSAYQDYAIERDKVIANIR
ncbi:hypothetical protein [Flavobacterium litorale]|uniref:Lipoprotein n=1 Tax=Flavobacterium litorale TaxID=2856519 RepID=A0ABX8VB95_9FLAO|nr:hypothetical protein [Flavobacterium litorale]QYJ67929.1 hypothetical protein K1I41_10335 [Flavobacterium litorale]